VVNWQHALEQKWAALRFGEVKVETDGKQHVFEVQVYLDELDPTAVRVELYANGAEGTLRSTAGDEVRSTTGGRFVNGYAYRAAVPGPPATATIRHASYRSATALRSRWKTLISCGSDDPPQKRRHDEESDCTNLPIPGYRRRAAHRRVGSSCPLGIT
jgi:hypothetical protein